MAKPGPKPKVYTDKEINQIAKLAGHGCTDEMIADIMLVPYGTFRADKERSEAIQTAIKNGRSDKLAQVMETAFNIAIDGKNPAMCMFILKTRAGWKETEPVSDDVPVDFEKLRSAV